MVNDGSEYADGHTLSPVTWHNNIVIIGKGASDFRSALGSLQPKIDTIVRCVLNACVIRPADADDTKQDATAAELCLASMETEELAVLGIDARTWGFLV